VRRLIGLGIASLAVLVLVVAQLALPGIAARHLRDQLARSGTVLSVKVSAFPAIELLWHRADSVVVRLGRYRSSSSNLGASLSAAADVGRLDASVQELDSGAITLHDATLRKRDNQFIGAATIMESDLRSGVPFLQNVQPIASSGGQLIMRGTASLLGVSATIDAVVSVRDGAIVVAPDIPFGGIATITVFANPHIGVRSVGASEVPGGFRLSAVAGLQ
jgi:hypothetical protein